MVHVDGDGDRHAATVALTRAMHCRRRGPIAWSDGRRDREPESVRCATVMLDDGNK